MSNQANINLNDTVVNVLSSFSKIVQDPTHIVGLNNDLIQTKGYGGSVGALYKPAEKITDVEFAVFDSTTFISLYQYLDEKTRQVYIDDPEIILKDESKEIRYVVCNMDMAPEINKTTLAAIDESEDVIGKVVLTDAFIVDVSEGLGKLDFDKAYLVSGDDLTFKLKLFSTTTENSMMFDIDKGKSKKPGLELELPSPDLFKNLYEGSYTLAIKNVNINDNDFIIGEFKNISLDEKEGELGYFAILELII